MSRHRFLFVLVAAVAAAMALAACSDGGGGDADPQAIVDDATLSGIESADLDLSLAIETSGEGGDLDVSLSGPFKGEGEGQNPQLAMRAEVSGMVNDNEVDFDGGLVLLPNSAYVNYEGIDYEVDPTTFSFVESTLKQQSGGKGATACQEAAGELDVSSFGKDLKDEGSADVGGTETTKLSGELDVEGALDALGQLSEDPACKTQLESSGAIPTGEELEKAEAEVKDAVKAANVDLYVGEDNIVRRIVAQLTIEPEGQGSEKVEVDVDLTLTGVNEEQEISAPAESKPLSDLFIKLRINPIELAGALQEGKGFGSLLETLGEALGEPAKGGGSGDGGRQAYLKCLGEASTPVDLQECTSLLN